jgi:hypothetical protein
MTGRSPDRGTRTPLVIEDRPAAPRDPGDAADLSIPWGKRANGPFAKKGAPPGSTIAEIHVEKQRALRAARRLVFTDG